MIHYEKFTLKNGLKVIFHKDTTTPLAVVNTLYDVGARDESEDQTGFAHLFEHLMFGGSVNISDFDAPLQNAGGESNAFTSNDITNYYNHLPSQNIETALWLESDRMLSLAFTDKSLEVQRNVVIEEFKQRYLNQPYGEVWLELRPLVYKVHPYKWATIGKNIQHIEDAKMDDVKAFFKKHYHPGNAILCIAGNFELEEVMALTEKWYGDIPAQEKWERNLPIEPKQTAYREKEIESKVPSDAFYYAFNMVDRNHTDYYVYDLISDALGRDKSSRLYNVLKKDLKLVSEVSAYVMGSTDAGMLMISGKLNPNVSFETLDLAIWNLLEDFKTHDLKTEELDRLKIKIRTSKEFQEQGLLNRAMNLCYYELLGDIEEINRENDHYAKISPEKIKQIANEVFQKTNCSLLKVKALKNVE